MPKYHTRHGHVCIYVYTDTPCKQMVFYESWRFLVHPLLEDLSSSVFIVVKKYYVVDCSFRFMQTNIQFIFNLAKKKYKYFVLALKLGIRGIAR